MKSQRKKKKIRRLIFVSAIAALLFSFCGEKEKVSPRLVHPGFRTKLLFEDHFNSDLDSWSSEGTGEATTTEDGWLCLSVYPNSDGMAIWLKQNLDNNFQIEYSIEISESSGLNIAMICAHGLNGEDILSDLSRRLGKQDAYTNGQIRSYDFSYHCISPSGIPLQESLLRKNPGGLLFSRADNDPCFHERIYFINITKLGNRIMVFVDDNLVHDIRDKGGFSPPYSKGKLGFWIGSTRNTSIISIDHIRIFELIPE